MSTRDSESSSVSTDFGIFTLHLLGLSSGLGSFNFLSTAKHQRHVGLTLIGVNIYVWAIIITSLLLVGALPILGVGLTGLLLDRNFATSIYDGVLGGDPVLYQHLFLTPVALSFYFNFNTTHVISPKKEMFCFRHFQDFDNGKYKHIDNEFLQWFVGMLEGDGCWYINHRNDMSFVVTQGTDDVQILHYIKDKLGFGSVIRQGFRTHRFVVHNLSDLYKILLICNGNIVLPSRQKKFLGFLNLFNKKAEANVKCLPIKPIQPLDRTTLLLPTHNDLWLLGFTDAEGCFSVSFLKASPTFRIRYILSQKGVVNLPILSHFILFFNAGTVEAHHVKENYGYILSGANNCIQVYSYFDKYMLKTKKAQSYELWKEVHQSILKQEHLNPNILPSLIEKAKLINKINKNSATPKQY